MALLLPVALLILLGSAAAAATAPPRPAPLASGPSVSGLWPRQAVAEASGETPLALAETFAIRASGGATPSSPRLQRAFARYEAIIREQKTLWTRSPAPATTLPLRGLDVVTPSGAAVEAFPALGDDESFALSVNASAATLHAATFSGVHRGLEAFAQLTIKLGGQVSPAPSSSASRNVPPLPLNPRLLAGGDQLHEHEGGGRSAVPLPRVHAGHRPALRARR